MTRKPVPIFIVKNVAQALARAKDNAGQLFAGIQFYVTPKVPVETKLLRNVVTANGGQVRTTLNSWCTVMLTGLCSSRHSR